MASGDEWEQAISELEFSGDPDRSLLLDLYKPTNSLPAPLVVYLHGGGFAAGDKASDRDRISMLASQGLTVAVPNYGLAPNARYPDQIHDVKAAIRFLRANAQGLGIDAGPIGVIGVSAGGYLATMVALSNGLPEFEGNIGKHLEHSSAVQAASPWFAPSNLPRSARRSALENIIMPVTFEKALLGGDLDEEFEQRLHEANPLGLVSSDAPPFLILHGDCDIVVPPAQSSYLQSALVDAGVSSSLQMVGGAGHEDVAFDQRPLLGQVAAWFRAHLEQVPE